MPSQAVPVGHAHSVAEGKCKKAGGNSSKVSQNSLLDVICIPSSHILLAKACHMAKSVGTVMCNPLMGKGEGVRN